MNRALRLGPVVAAAVLLAAALATTVWMVNGLGEAPLDERSPPVAGSASAEQIERGAYLARAGNCAGCHTERGGPAYAGGRGIDTPFGTVYASNLTPDVETGLGRWSPAAFWRALHHGRSRDGRLLYPAFPYPNFTHVTREDSDALHAYLHSLAPVARPNRAHELRFPFDSQAALAIWRALYFRPAAPGDGVAGAAAPQRVAGAEADAWQRGAYLVEGLGHCSACHAERNALGASAEGLGGGLIPAQNWYAPALDSVHAAGVADWPEDQIVALLQTGRTERATTLGPMASVVLGSTQYLSDTDLRSMAVYLRRLPPAGPPAAPAAAPAMPSAAGARLYETHCAACHGERGEGVAGVYPALAGNRAVLLVPAVNLMRVVLEGGFAPSTAGNPRPYGMPPFANVLSEADVAELLTHIRGSWGHAGSAVSALDVHRWRNAP